MNDELRDLIEDFQLYLYIKAFGDGCIQEYDLNLDSSNAKAAIDSKQALIDYLEGKQ